MPFDDPQHFAATAAPRNRAVAQWLLVICFMIAVMIVLGGATRVTGSGLSIMEWAPLSGTLPPLSRAEWQRLYHLYQQIPQYQLVNSGIGIDGFRHIFWLEWTHRLWGRLIGVVFLVPLVVFVARGLLCRLLLPRLLLIFALGGLQGAVGWFMVASGFIADTTAVAPVRLVVHLALALLLYAAILWTGLSLLRPAPRPGPAGPWRLLQAVVALVALTMLAGGFTAGLHAGLSYNTFPLMDGRLVPEGYASMTPFLANLIGNVAAVQFDHRLLATATALTALAAACYGLVRRGPARVPLLALGLAVILQYALGVATLLLVVPPALAVIHQTVAVLVLTAAIVALHAARPVQRTIP